MTPLPYPDATLSSLAPPSYAVVTCRHPSPTIYADEPTYAAIATRRDAWIAVKTVNAARRLAGLGVAPVGAGYARRTET